MYLKIDLPPTKEQIEQAQIMINIKTLSDNEKNEILFTDKYETPEDVQEFLKSNK